MSVSEPNNKNTKFSSEMPPEDISDISSEEEMEEDVVFSEMNDEQKAEQAEIKKAEGNAHYVNKNYQTAIGLYSQAIEFCPTCAAYYSNRAASYMMLLSYEKGLIDARQAVTLDPNFIKGHLREAKCHLAMGEVAAALVSYQKVINLDPNNMTAKNEINQVKTIQQHMVNADASYAKQDYRTVLYCMDRCIEASPDCPKFKILKGECLVYLKRYQEAQDIVNDILRVNSSNADAVYVRGLCFYYQDNIEKAFQHFQQTLRFAPDHSKARDVYKKAKLLTSKKEEGNNEFRSARYAQAVQVYTDALNIDPLNLITNSKIFCNRATAYTKLNKLDEALADFNKAIEVDASYQKAFQRRAKCYMDREMYEEAVRDYEKVCQMEKNKENKRLLQDAKLQLKKSKRKDYYKILGVEKGANEDEIKKAYKKRALLHHPDRHASADDKVKKVEEQKFKEIGEAYNVLSDTKKKARYDNGQDLEDLDGGCGGFSDIDPNLIFQSFFGGSGGGFSHGGHGQRGGGGNSFHFQTNSPGYQTFYGHS